MNSKIIALKSVEAYQRISEYIVKTPLLKNQKTNSNLYIKAENLQYTSSFKLRGAASKLTFLKEQGCEVVITASTGNHGMATAYMLNKLKMEGDIYVPTNIKQSKEKKLSSYQVCIIKYGKDSEISEVRAREVAVENNIPFISPYNDIEVIAGQGTIGIELVDQISKIDHLFITVGGGGLISGITCVLREYFPKLKVYGCQPENSSVMYQSVNAGEIIQIESLDTLSDGSAGGIEKDSITFALCQELIDEFVLITEEEIKNAMKLAFTDFNLIVEGAAGVALAAYLKKSNEISGNAVVISCGGNVDHETWLNIIQS